MKVKGKALNTFLGIVKTDMPRLAIEAFPQEINKKLISLQLLKQCDLVWFDLQIEQRVATLRGNFFVGYNLGQNNVYKIGILCLIGIAHLPTNLEHLRHSDQLELRPCLSTNIGEEVKAAMMKFASDEMKPIIGNLIYSLKLIASKILPKLPVGGNVKYDDIWDDIDDIMSSEAGIRFGKRKKTIKETDLEFELQQFPEEDEKEMTQNLY